MVQNCKFAPKEEAQATTGSTRDSMAVDSRESRGIELVIVGHS